MATTGLLGCPPAGHAGQPHPGRIEFEAPARIPVPLGFVDAIGGNLQIQRTDLSSDTMLGPLDLGAVFNSATGRWLWSFEMSLDGSVFVDDSGAEHDVKGLADGRPVAGTRWLRDAMRAMRTKAGLVYVFDRTGRLHWIQMSRASFPRITFGFDEIDGRRRTTRIAQCISEGGLCVRIADVAYDADGHVLSLSDPRSGRVARFAWDGDRLVGARSPMEVDEGRPGQTYTYDLLGRLASLTTGDGERLEYAWDGARVTEVRRIGDGDPSDRFVYEDEASGLFTTRHWDTSGVEHRYVYDGQDRLQRVTNVASGLSTIWTWGAASRRPESRTEPGGETTGFAWQHDDLVAKIEPSGNVVRYTYAPDALSSDGWTVDGWPKERPSHRAYLHVEDSLGLVEEDSYDELGRRLSTTNGAGETTTFEYQNRPGANVCSDAVCVVVAPDGTHTDLSYTLSGHPATLDGSRSTGFGLTAQQREYDAAGNLLSGSLAYEAGPGGVVRREYDADRNLRALELEDGGRITFEVRSDGQRTAVRRPGGDDHEMDYDALGRMTARRERADGRWHETVFAHDAMGRTTRVLRPNGMEQRATYDAEGHLVDLRSYRDGVLESESLSHYEAGRLSRRDDSTSGSAFFGYDAAGRLVWQQHPDGTSTAWTWDLRGRKRSESYLTTDAQLLRSLGYEYDLADREIEVRDGLAPLLTRDIEDGRLLSIAYGSGLVRSNDYDEDGVFLGTRATLPDGTLVAETTLQASLNRGGVHTAADTTLYSGDEVWTHSENVDLVSSTGVDFYTARVGREGDTPFTFDEQSNLLERGSTRFTFNAEGNRLLSAETAGEAPLAFVYDEAGYTVLRGSRAITWTAAGRLASYGADTLQWDAAGHLMAATVDGVRSEWRFGGRVSTTGGSLRIARKEFVIDVGSNEHLYRHLDYRNNVAFTTDDLGEIRAGYGYTPFGRTTVWGSDADPARFAGRNGFADLMLLGARVYDPATGRFLSQDPVFGDVNQYAYTLGNPIWWWDPDGAEASNNTAQGVAKVFGLTGAMMALIALSLGIEALAIFAAALVFIGALGFFFSRVDPSRLWDHRAPGLPFSDIDPPPALWRSFHPYDPRRNAWT